MRCERYDPEMRVGGLRLRDHLADAKLLAELLASLDDLPSEEALREYLEAMATHLRAVDTILREGIERRKDATFEYLLNGRTE